MWVAKSQTMHGFLDPIAAEAWAALMAVQLCNEMGILLKENQYGKFLEISKKEIFL
jgi:hypothetical protein